MTVLRKCKRCKQYKDLSALDKNKICIECRNKKMIVEKEMATGGDAL